ncbi:MAG: hypothetical protein KA368_24520 [Acidobacteria bacterium]|nr:hypothetical protein [Acidobacteriota bacterium]
MENMTLSGVMTAAKHLSPDEKWQLRLMLDKELNVQNGFKSIEQLMQEQGTRPRSFEEMLGPVPGEEADDDVDEFLKELYQWRSEQTIRDID